MWTVQHTLALSKSWVAGKGRRIQVAQTPSSKHLPTCRLCSAGMRRAPPPSPPEGPPFPPPPPSPRKGSRRGGGTGQSLMREWGGVVGRWDFILRAWGNYCGFSVGRDLQLLPGRRCGGWEGGAPRGGQRPGLEWTEGTSTGTWDSAASAWKWG